MRGRNVNREGGGRENYGNCVRKRKENSVIKKEGDREKEKVREMNENRKREREREERGKIEKYREIEKR